MVNKMPLWSVMVIILGGIIIFVVVKLSILHYVVEWYKSLRTK